MTASSEEPGNFEQAHQRWLLLHVHALIRYWDCGSDCCDMAFDQIFVIPTTMMRTTRTNKRQREASLVVFMCVFVSVLMVFDCWYHVRKYSFGWLVFFTHRLV